jgi:hypothetical protein
MWSGRDGHHCSQTTSEHTAVLCNQDPSNTNPRSVGSILNQLQPRISLKNYYKNSPLSPQCTVTYSIFVLRSFPSAWCNNFCVTHTMEFPFVGPDFWVIRTTQWSGKPSRHTARITEELPIYLFLRHWRGQHKLCLHFHFSTKKINSNYGNTEV